MNIYERKNFSFIIILIVITIFSSIILVGCKENREISSKSNTAKASSSFEVLGKDTPEDTVLLIVNNPSSDQLKLVTISENLELDETSEQILLIPRNTNSTISIWSLKFTDNNLVPNKKIYECEKTPENFVLSTKLISPEGIPQYKVEITSENLTSEYIFSYDGKNGTPNIEYISANIK
ncbi:putative lipoprotein [Clostridium argentinense CDC 2741]|uniref:Putative lipoprotein n=1 Tax=Clostridium argentinense CDC 2741 TaxID=1418104 RepID=A0A0C1R6E3_9CLOT|nr:hypothetical protein [Clostridium argentinense]ARC86068.1 hypothetical protein RSJ17_17000 [Clostridium argentinense]KIE46046.1 putative lipoprotein [Clostridium argentinense CDC 2741]NFF39008.1 hypothetical protein [Clostridium argentinense]NFP48800.1 hypothetical protein [Clostridium argentinense]NFP70932.1 hypothetical protein [Clostridium argentinense]